MPEDKKLTPYRVVYSGFSTGKHLLPLNPSGRWKLVTYLNSKDDLYIEHKYFIFKEWIHEDDIVFGYAPKEEIFYP